MVFDIAERTMWFAEGNPSQAQWNPISLFAEDAKSQAAAGTAGA
jgi:hypothetical protein